MGNNCTCFNSDNKTSEAIIETSFANTANLRKAAQEDNSYSTQLKETPCKNSIVELIKESLQPFAFTDDAPYGNFEKDIGGFYKGRKNALGKKAGCGIFI